MSENYRQSSLSTFFLITLALLVSAALFGYIFLFTVWSASFKFICVLIYLILLLVGTNRFLSSKINTLRYQLQSDGLGEDHLFLDLYQNSPVPYVRTDKAGTILHCNAAAVRLFKNNKDSLVSSSLFNLIRENELEAVSDVFSLEQQIIAGQFINEAAVEIPFEQGELRYALLSSFPYAHNKERLITLIDITEQKKVDIAKTEFVSLASHQLRTPISAMLWNLELLSTQSNDLTEKQKDYIDKVHRSINKMNGLVNDFLDATKLEMGTFATKTSPLEINTFISNICSEFESQVVKKDLNLQVELLDSSPTVNTDEHILHMVVSNLISNAVKYTKEHGSVLVSVENTNNTISFRIRDTGIGVPAADQSLLFSKLYRASNTKTSETEGTGLGLYVVKQAVEILGGSISFVSVEGEGTEFVVNLPI